MNCLFHFGQCHYRKIVELGFKSRYNKDEDFAVLIRSFTALSLIELDDVEFAFEKLVVECKKLKEPGLDDFVEYFKKNFIGEKKRKGPRKPPTYPIKQWNTIAR